MYAAGVIVFNIGDIERHFDIDSIESMSKWHSMSPNTSSADISQINTFNIDHLINLLIKVAENIS